MMAMSPSNASPRLDPGPHKTGFPGPVGILHTKMCITSNHIFRYPKGKLTWPWMADVRTGT